MMVNRIPNDSWERIESLSSGKADRFCEKLNTRQVYVPVSLLRNEGGTARCSFSPDTLIFVNLDRSRLGITRQYFLFSREI